MSVVFYLLIFFPVRMFSELSVHNYNKNEQDDTHLIQQMINAKLSVNFGKNKTYNLYGSIFLNNGQKVYGENVKFIQHERGVPIFDCRNKKNIEIKNLYFVGFGNDYQPTSSSKSVGIYCPNAERLNVSNNVFENFSYSPISGVRNVKDILIIGNKFYGPKYKTFNKLKDITGVTLGGKNITVRDNFITGTSQGIVIAEESSTVLIKHNIIKNLPLEHGIYVDSSCSDVTIVDNSIDSVGGSGIKIQNRNLRNTFCKNFYIAYNKISNTGNGDGILVNNAEEIGVIAENVMIFKNEISKIGQDGINVRFSKHATIEGNHILDVKRAGIYLKENDSSTVGKNIIQNTLQNGIFDEGTGKNILIEKNTLTNVGTAGIHKNGLSSGILIQNANYRTIIRNIVNGNPNYTQYALYLPKSNNQTVVLQDNEFYGAKEFGIRCSKNIEDFKLYLNNKIKSVNVKKKILIE